MVDSLYLDKDKSLELFQQLETVRQYYCPEQNGSQVAQLLEDLSGVLNGQTFYRPYAVAAYFIEVQREINVLKKADGAEFTNFDRTATTYRGMQRIIDGSTEGLKLADPLKIPVCDPCSQTANGNNSNGVIGGEGGLGLLVGSTRIERYRAAF